MVAKCSQTGDYTGELMSLIKNTIGILKDAGIEIVGALLPKKIKEKTRADLSEIKAFRDAKELIKICLKSQKFDGMVLIGEAGLGKSELIFEAMSEVYDADYVYINGYVSPLSLYKKLYNAKDKQVVVLDDASWTENAVSLSILKGALWSLPNGERRISYSSASKSMEGLPSQFNPNFKIIVVCNEVRNLKSPHIKALWSRVLNYTMKLNKKEKAIAMKKILELRKDLEDSQKEEVTSVLKSKDFNFRDLEKVCEFVKYGGNAKSLFESITAK